MPSDIVLPAHAGMILVLKRGGLFQKGAPRTRGDDPLGNWSPSDFEKCSPHTRG